MFSWRPRTFSVFKESYVDIPLEMIISGVSYAGFSIDQNILENSYWISRYGKPAFFIISPEIDIQGHNPELVKLMFRRISILARGGSVESVDSKLLAAGLPPVDKTFNSSLVGTITPDSILPQNPNLQFVFSCSYLAENAEDYWPGNSYVDWVGQSIRVDKETSLQPLSRFYETYPFANKPYMISDVSFSGDHVDTLDYLFYWTQKRNRAKMICLSDNDQKILSLKNSLTRIRNRVAGGSFEPYPKDNNPPFYKLISPDPGETVSGVIPVKIELFDDDYVYYAEIRIGDDVILSKRVIDGIFWWDTRKHPNGICRVQIKLVDSNGEESVLKNIDYEVQNNE
jgi:hypothetical protein